MAKAKKLPSGRWRALVYSHTESVWDDEKQSYVSKRKYESFDGDTEDEANFKAAEFKFTRNRRSRPEKLTLYEAIDKYINSCDNLLSPTSVYSYRRIQKNAFQNIMDTKIADLTNDILLQAVNEEAKRPSKKSSKNQTPISPKTLHDEYGLICTVLRRYVPSLNTNVKLPQKVVKIKEIIEPETIFRIIEDESVEFKLAVSLAMWLSFTKSEIRGLKRSSIYDGHLQINQVIVDAGNKTIEKKQAKVFTRNRKHKIPPYIQSLIDQLPPDQEYLVTLNGHQLYKRWVRILKNNNLPHMTFHDLRHVNASVMALLQIPDKYAMERGGWKTDSTMKGTYTHTFSQARKDVDHIIDDYFEKQLTGDKKAEKKDNSFLNDLDLSEDELKKVMEYAAFIKSQSR
ncbi:tyrosine-type recombinase/integrase [Lachnospiraceae bacterium 50-23]